MKVIFVTAHLPYGTDEAFIVPEIDELIRAGHQVLVVPRSPKGAAIHGQRLLAHTRREPLFSRSVIKEAAKTASASPGKVFRAGKPLLRARSAHIVAKNLAMLPKALWLASIARKWGADHIHAHWAGTTATLAMIASRVSGIPWSFTAHRWDVVENNLLDKKVESALLARFISADGLRMAREIGVGPAPHARVLGMGVMLPPQVERPTSAWPIVVCPARLVEVKGHRILLKAWRILRDRGIHGELWLAGDGELRPQLEAFVQTFGLHNYVKFLGTVPHAELLRIYREVPVSLVVLASTDLGHGLHEGIPVALMEAMAHGIPVIATDTGGTPELVRAGTGLLVPAGDPVKMAEAIETLIQDNDLLRQVGDSARRHVSETHDVVKIASDLIATFCGEAGAQKIVASA